MDHVGAEDCIGGLNWPIGVARIQNDRWANARTIGLDRASVDICKRVKTCLSRLPLQARRKTGCNEGCVLTATTCDLEN